MLAGYSEPSFAESREGGSYVRVRGKFAILGVCQRIIDGFERLRTCAVCSRPQAIHCEQYPRGIVLPFDRPLPNGIKGFLHQFCHLEIVTYLPGYATYGERCNTALLRYYVIVGPSSRNDQPKNSAKPIRHRRLLHCRKRASRIRNPGAKIGGLARRFVRARKQQRADIFWDEFRIFFQHQRCYAGDVRSGHRGAR